MTSFLSDKNINYLRYKLRQIMGENQWNNISENLFTYAHRWFRIHSESLELIYRTEGLKGLNNAFIEDMIRSDMFNCRSIPEVGNFDGNPADPNTVIDQPRDTLYGTKPPYFLGMNLNRTDPYSPDATYYYGDNGVRYLGNNQILPGQANGLVYDTRLPGNVNYQSRVVAGFDGYYGPKMEREQYRIPYDGQVSFARKMEGIAVGDMPIIQEMSQAEITDLGHQLYRMARHKNKYRKPLEEKSIYENSCDNQVTIKGNRSKFKLPDQVAYNGSRISTGPNPCELRLWGGSKNRNVLGNSQFDVPDSDTPDAVISNGRMYVDGYEDGKAIKIRGAHHPTRNAIFPKDFVPTLYNFDYSVI